MITYWRLLQLSWSLVRIGFHELVPIEWQEQTWRLVLLNFFAKKNIDRPQAIKKFFQNNGPVIIKFGQLLSTRPDLITAEVAKALSDLQDRVPAFDFTQVKHIIETMFRRPLEQIFQDFHTQPVASASVAQVHLAKLSNGDAVAVKVLRPNIREAVERDLRLLYALAKLMQYVLVDGARMRPHDVVRELEKHLRQEIDLVQEAANCAQIKRNFAQDTTVKIPDIYWNLCSEQVIVMQQMQGIPIRNFTALECAGVALPQLSQRVIHTFFKQVFIDGIFHADFHPGNLWVNTDPQNLGQLVLLDFGIVASLNETDKDYLARNFLAFFKRDYQRVAQLHIESGWVPARTPMDELESTIRRCCEPHFDRPAKDISLADVLFQLFQASRRFGVDIQPQLTMLQKTLLNVEGLTRQLDPELDLWEHAEPVIAKWMKSQTGVRSLLRRLKDEAPFYIKFLPEFPRLLAQQFNQRKELNAIVEEQKKQWGWVQRIFGFVIGFIIALVLLPLLTHLYWYFH